MNFTTVLCFKGMHEVARELSNPYNTVPNDLPLNNFQAQFNEALVTMYAGFHPDSWKKQEVEEEVEEQTAVEEDDLITAPEKPPDLAGVSDEEKEGELGSAI
jgi:hypothetical protein